MGSYTILTRNGVADAGQEGKLAALAAELQRSGARLLLHLHGGLVDQRSGEATAARLSGTGPDSWRLGPEWTQVYVVWRTGAFETIRTNWLELVHDDRLYQTILRKLIGFVARKLGLPAAAGRGAGSLALDEAEIQRRITGRGDSRAPFEAIDALLAPERPSGARAAVATEQSNGDLALEFSTELAADPDFQRAAIDVDEAINVPIAARAPSLGADAATGGHILARLSEDVRAGLVPPPADPATGRRGIVSAGAVLLAHAGKIALRCFKRFRSDRDHGLHATIVEEVCRELYGDLVGAKVWGMMVDDAADHFGAGRLGSQLVEMLCTGPADIVITAHSAGSIWASRLLLAMQASGLTRPVKLFLLAPAVRHDLFDETIRKAGSLVGRCHMFTMSDALERRDAVLGHDKGYIYPSSLLYLVSGLFEERAARAYPDAPLVGMQRFGGVSWLSAEEAPAAQRIAAFFQAPDRGILCSPAPGVTVADSHSAFASEALTLASARALF